MIGKIRAFFDDYIAMLDQSGRASYNRANDGVDYRNTEEFYNAQQMMSWVELNMMKYEDY